MLARGARHRARVRSVFAYKASKDAILYAIRCGGTKSDIRKWDHCFMTILEFRSAVARTLRTFLQSRPHALEQGLSARVLGDPQNAYTRELLTGNSTSAVAGSLNTDRRENNGRWFA